MRQHQTKVSLKKTAAAKSAGTKTDIYVMLGETCRFWQDASEKSIILNNTSTIFNAESIILNTNSMILNTKSMIFTVISRKVIDDHPTIREVGRVLSTFIIRLMPSFHQCKFLSNIIHHSLSQKQQQQCKNTNVKTVKLSTSICFSTEKQCQTIPNNVKHSKQLF